jgi:acyl carrier protein
MSTEDKIRTFIVKDLAFDGPPGEPTPDYLLFETRSIDSLGVYELVSFLETEFNITIGDEELVPEHFGTLRGIVSLVESKR